MTVRAKADESRLELLGISGLRRVDPIYLVEYEQAMHEEGIPKIIEAVKSRVRFVAESRQRILF